MIGYCLVFLGAGLGGILRHGANVMGQRLLGGAFPWSTLAVNVIGCTVMGCLAGGILSRAEFGSSARLFLATGILGGFTTFSAFSLDAALLWERGTPALAALYVVASVGGSLIGLAGGLMLARTLS